MNVKNSPFHICAKSRKDYIEPETQFFKDDKNPYYKILIYDEKYFSSDSSLYRLEKQFLNGYYVKSFSELWVYRGHFMGPESRGVNKWIWLDQQSYFKLVFL